MTVKLLQWMMMNPERTQTFSKRETRHYLTVADIGQRIRCAKTDEELDAAYQYVNRYVAEKLRKGKNPPIISLQRAAVGFCYQPATSIHFIRVLRRIGIPFIELPEQVYSRRRGKVISRTYYFIATHQQPRVYRCFLHHPDTFEYYARDHYGGVVKRAAGPLRRPPTTTEIRKKEQYYSVGNLFTELGFSQQQVAHNYPALIGILLLQCPVPIWRYKERFVYPADQKDAMREFIKERLSAITRLVQSRHSAADLEPHQKTKGQQSQQPTVTLTAHEG